MDMANIMNEKFNSMKDFFRGKSVLVAYSGGMDSSTLIHFLNDLPDVKLTAVTVLGPHIPQEEFKRSKEICRKFNINHLIIEANPLKLEGMICNDENRCYFCKTAVFNILKSKAVELQADIVCDGTNVTDKSDFRPGMRALKELEVFSPFLEFGIGKEEIKSYLIENGLADWITPSNACLISRVPYGLKFDEKDLAKIDTAETFIRSLGIKQVRCRLHSDLVRIEVLDDDLHILIDNKKKIFDRLSKIGFKYITFDLRGYKTGGAN